jgi:carbamoyl-phosphate synthase small subunit
MADARPMSAPQPKGATGVIVFSDGRIVWGKGFGAEGEAVGELCFNTAMTGYQEVMTDPSYAKQVIAFTFPHIGNVGANDEDVEAAEAHALGCLVREVVTEPSNYRANEGFADWMRKWGRIGICGVDTRALTKLVREEGPPTVTIAYDAKGEFDVERLQKLAADWPGLEGMDLAKDVSRLQIERWTGGKWQWGVGYAVDTPLPLAGGVGGGPVKGSAPSQQAHPPTPSRWAGGEDTRPHVVAVDYGNKRNIFRNLVEAGARVTVVPASATFDEIMAHEPDGFFLSNGPGDPAAVEYAPGNIRKLAEAEMPLFGICLGHQMLGLTFGGETEKMPYGHRGGNHPVQDLSTGHVLITSQNHGFAVDPDTLPSDVKVTHVNLYDHTVEGLRHETKPVFCVQYHPEAAPGPHDADYLFRRFLDEMEKRA